MRLRFGLLLALSGCLWISAEEHRVRMDGDGDGVPAGEDCDDANAQISPEKPEKPCDAVDNDCNPGSPDGPAAIGDITFATVQEAIDGADTGDTVVLCPGVYAEAVVVPNAITLTGSIDPESTVIDATGLDAPAATITGPGATLRQLMLTGGTGGPNSRPDLAAGERIGGGLNAVGATGEVVLSDVVVAGNAADVGGGVFAPAAAPLRLVRAVVRENVATDLGGGVAVPLVGSFEDAEVSSNEAGTSGGGVVLLSGATVTASPGAVLSDNSAPTGGGLLIAADASWTGGRIADNEGSMLAGGVYLDAGILAEAVVEDNFSAQGGGVAGAGVVEATSILHNTASTGGGVYVLGDLVLVGATAITENTAQIDAGGGVHVVGGVLRADEDTVRVDGNRALGKGAFGGGIAATTGGLDLYATSVVGNTAESGAGIAIRTAGLCPSCTFAFTAVTLEGNQATRSGGGLWTDTTISVNVGTFRSNSSGEDGGGLFVSDGAVTVSGATFASNSAVGMGGGLAVRSTAGTTDVGLGAVFLANDASDGGAIHVGAGADVVVSSSEITENTFGTSGGAVALEPGGAVQTRYASQSGTTYSGNDDDTDVHAGSIRFDNDPDDAEFTCTYLITPVCN